MSCLAITGGSPSVWSAKENIETALMGIANILFVAGAIYMIYMSGNTGMDLVKSSEFWGFLVPSSLMAITFFTSTLIKQANQTQF